MPHRLPPIEVPTLFAENTETVRARLLRRLPQHWSREEGSFPRDMVEMCVYEATMMWTELNRVLAQTFVSSAQGEFLDRHADGYGIQRGQGARALGYVRFTGDPGTFVPPATSISMPTTDPDADPIRFTTTNTSSAVIADTGYVDVEVEAVTVGADHNVAAGALTLLGTPLPGVSEVMNLAPTYGGEDPQDDDSLRADLLDQARLPVGAGNRLDYAVFGKEIAGVSDVAVEPLWDRSGDPPGSGNPNLTVAVALRDLDHAPVSWQTLQAAQKHIDPSRQVVALLEQGEAWTTVAGLAPAWSTSRVQIGESALRLSTSAAELTTVLELVRPLDLSRFQLDDDFYLWLYSDAWQNVSDSSYMRFHSSSFDYYTIPFGPAAPSPDVLPRPTTGAAWWLLRARKGSFTTTGFPNWANVISTRLGLVSTAAVDLVADYFTIRSRTGATGEGKAPIGHSVTVFTPVPKAINVAATLTLQSGYAISGQLGVTDVRVTLDAALRDFLRRLQPGEPVRVKDLENVIHDLPGVEDFVMTAPAANVPVSLNQYAVLGTLTLS